LPAPNIAENTDSRTTPSTREDITALWQVFAAPGQALPSFEAFEKGVEPLIPAALRRSSDFLSHPVFNTHHSETQMLRYLRSLSDKDLALDRTMIPLGSCTMKLNATTEMIPITWPEFAGVHVFDANPLVAQKLADMGLLLNQPTDKITIDRYPHGWRSKKPVIFRNTPQWFIHMDMPISPSPRLRGEGPPLTLTLSPQAGRGGTNVCAFHLKIGEQMDSAPAILRQRSRC
jgi:hypothetical protein